MSQPNSSSCCLVPVCRVARMTPSPGFHSMAFERSAQIAVIVGRLTTFRDPMTPRANINPVLQGPLHIDKTHNNYSTCYIHFDDVGLQRFRVASHGAVSVTTQKGSQTSPARSKWRRGPTGTATLRPARKFLGGGDSFPALAPVVVCWNKKKCNAGFRSCTRKIGGTIKQGWRETEGRRELYVDDYC